MDEQRLAAYLELIQALLECPSGANDILNAHRELVDADFVQVMEVVAADMAAEGNSNAGWWQNLAAHLKNSIGNTTTPEEYLSFLMEVLLVVLESLENPQIVYPFLQQNLDKLDLKFADVLQNWATSTFTEVPSEQAESLAGVIVNFGNLIQQFPLGRRASNLEIGIAAYKQALTVVTLEAIPQKWAIIQNNLGNAYSNRIKGDKGENIELAIAAFEQALTVRTFELIPQDWAATTNNLANAYSNRIKGDKGENIELAIAAFKQVLQTIYTFEALPQDWAATTNNLGEAYRNRIKEDKGENIELAIAAFEQALTVHNFETFPQDWAMTKNNLGNAYSNRLKGDQGENIELAIAAFEQALTVRTFEALPQDWATTQNNLGSIYWNRIKGDKGENIELAIAAFEQALTVRTFESLPQYWAETTNNLGNLYRNRIKGDKGENIERAIAAFEQALTVLIFEAFPQNWAATKNNLGNAYHNRIKGNKGENIALAIATYKQALTVYTPAAFPWECLVTGTNLGNTAFTAGFWDIALEGFDKAIQAVEKSRSWATSDDLRQQILAESIGVYEKAIQAAVNNNQLEKAIEYCDRTRAQRLVDLMHSNDLYASGEIPPAVQKYLREFEAKQQEIDAEVEQLRNPSEGDKGLANVGSQSRSRASLSAYTEKIQELEADKQQIWENIRRLDPVLAGQVQVDPMQFAAMQQLIDNSQTAILCFYTTTDDTHVFVIYKDKAPQIHTCHGEGWASFQQWIEQTWLLPYDNDDKTSWQQGMGEFLSQLSLRLKVDELIGNCLDEIEELIVIPHLFLHQIPLAALPIDPPQPPLRRGEQELQVGAMPPCSPPRFLGDKFLLRYVPSCRILEYCSKRPTIESLKYGIVENANDDLPFASFECEQVAKIVPVKQRLKGSKEATVAEYRNMVKTINGLHSSHHAKSDLTNPLKSHLLLGDGSITLGELMTPGWRMPELSDVFLSCCETNLGVTEITDDILSLGTGFLCAGARSVVSTLWKVEPVTGLFSIFYYQYRQKGLSRPEALRDAQVRLRTISGEGLHQLCDLIIKKLNGKLLKVQGERKELKLRQESYKRNTVEYKELKDKLLGIVKPESKIQEEIEWYKGMSEQFSAMSNPFDDLIYWSGFICQGLH